MTKKRSERIKLICSARLICSAGHIFKQSAWRHAHAGDECREDLGYVGNPRRMRMCRRKLRVFAGAGPDA